MNNLLKQSTSVVRQIGPFLDIADGLSELNGLASALDNASTGIMLSKNGGTQAVRHATVTTSVYDAHGMYKVTLDATDTGTLGSLFVIYTDPATCLPVWKEFTVVTAQIYDSLIGGTDNLQADAVQVNGNSGAAANLDRAARAIGIGTVGSASTTTSIVTSSLTPAAAVTDQFKGRIVIFDKDTTTVNLRGQATDITASSSGGVLTVTALTTAPVSGDTFTIT